MKYEEAINKIQGNGRFHIFLLIVLSLLPLLAALDMNSLIFFGYEPKFKCVDTRNDSTVIWDKSNQCQGYRIKENGENETVKCRKWKYDTKVMKRTFVTEFDLVCDRGYLKASIETIFYVGCSIGNLLGIFGDKFGRKNVLVICSLLEFLINMTLPFLPNLLSIIVFRFLWGFTNSKLFQGICILMETLSINKRSFYGNNYWMFWIIGYMTIPGIAFAVRDWRYMKLFSCIPYGFYLLLYFVPESPRWLSISGKHKEAKKSLIYIAKYNGVKLKESDFDELEIEEAQGKLSDLFCYPEMRKKMLVGLVIQATVSMSYFGLSINDEFISKNIFLNVFVQGTLEILTGPAGWITSSKWNRKGSLLVYFLVTAVTLEISAFASLNQSITMQLAKAVFGIIGKFSLTTAYCVMDIYILEVYPTIVRNLAMFLVIGIGSFGTIFAPWINTLGTLYSSSIYSAMCVVSGLMVWFLLPETKGCPLPQTIQEGELLRRNNEQNYCKMLTNNNVEIEISDISVNYGRNGNNVELNLKT